MIFNFSKAAPRSSPHENHRKIMKFHDDQSSDFQDFVVKSEKVRIEISIGRSYVLQVLWLGQLQASWPIGVPASAPKRRPHSGETKACHDRNRFFADFMAFISISLYISQLPLDTHDLCAGKNAQN